MDWSARCGALGPGPRDEACQRFELSYRDVEELLAERGITVDHVTVYRWVQRFTPLLIDAASPRRHAREIAGSWTRRCAARRDVTERG
jgi:hypothetical protein